MKYIKLTPEFIKDVTAHDEVCDYIIFSNEFWQGFIKLYPQHIVESVPVEDKEREELLMVASMMASNGKPYIAEYVVAEAVQLISAVNAACEKKEDKA